MGFVVDKVALGWVFSEYFGFPFQILHYHNHPGQATIGESVAAVPSGPSWTTHPTKRIKEKLKKKKTGQISALTQEEEAPAQLVLL
jgi:hypothetical protein